MYTRTLSNFFQYSNSEYSSSKKRHFSYSMFVFNRGVNRAEISGPARKIVFFSARPAINVL